MSLSEYRQVTAISVTSAPFSTVGPFKIMSLFERLREAVAATLNVPEDTIGPESSSDDIAAWDSLGQINLMVTLEQTFDILLDVEDFSKLTSIPAMLSYLRAQGIEDS